MDAKLRQDIVSGDWIILATNRGKRPHELIKKKKNKRKVSPLSTCPFENPQANGNKEPILIYGDRNNWRVQVLENKYPALTPHNSCPQKCRDGEYVFEEAYGYHDLVISRDHNKNFGQMISSDLALVLSACRDRYLMYLADKCIAYVSIYHNWGPTAGASVYHPHFQLIALPEIPVHRKLSLVNAERYFKENKKCAHCTIVGEELRHKDRIIFENELVVAFAPFFSEEPFEIDIFLKKHSSYFEDSNEAEIGAMAEALGFVLSKFKKNLDDPDYNFYIHTAPVKNKKNYEFYHWHMVVRPKITIMAGFEISTGVEINVVDPDVAAQILKK